MTNRGVFKGVGTFPLPLDRKRVVNSAEPVNERDLSTKRYANLVGAGVPDYVQPVAGTLKNKYSMDRGIYNFKASNSRRLDQGRSDAMTGGVTRHLVIGDSVTAGCTSGVVVTTYDRLHAWPYMMRDQMACTGIPANGTGFVKIADNTTTDARWTTTGSWLGQTTWTFSNTVNSTITLTPDRPGTIFDLWYLNSTSTFTISIDGATSGANFATVTTNTSSAWFKYRMYGVTINEGSKITIKLTVAGAGIGLSGGAVWTPNAGVIVDNIAISGSKAATGTSTNWSDLVNGPLAVMRYVGGKAVTITDAATTSGANTITSASSSFNAAGDTLLGEPIDQFPDASGALFPPNTYITGRTSATVLTTNNNALVTASGKTLRLSRDPHVVHIAIGGNDIQTGGAGGANVNLPAEAIATIAALYPNSDIVLHLENEGSSTLWYPPDYPRWQQRVYKLADDIDAMLYDWRDRAGTYAVALNNGVFQDYQAHMIPGMYADLGSSLAQAFGGGSGTPQVWAAPVYDGDVTNKLYVDNAALEPVNTLAPGPGGFETFSRFFTAVADRANPAATGRLLLVPIILPKGYTLGHIGFCSGTTAAGTPTHYWFGLYSSAWEQLALTADQTTTAWAANTVKSLAVATTKLGTTSTFTTTYAGLHYIGIMMTATTLISFKGIAAPDSVLTAIANANLAGLSDSTQTTPPAFPHTATAVTGSPTVIPYAYVTA